MDVAAGLVPCAEGAGSDIGADALCAATVMSPFPIVDDSRTISGQMGEPATSHEAVENFVSAVFNKMCAVDEENACALVAGGAEVGGALGDLRALGRSTVGWWRGGVNEYFVDGSHAVALSEGQHF